MFNYNKRTIRKTIDNYDKKGARLGTYANRGGGSDPLGQTSQPPYLVIRNVKTTSHFVKVTPLIWGTTSQNK